MMKSTRDSSKSQVNFQQDFGAIICRTNDILLQYRDKENKWKEEKSILIQVIQ